MENRQQEFATAMRGFYLWRCGTAVVADYGGEHYCTGECHLEDGLTDYVDRDIYGKVSPDNRRDGNGGWHDAGDFGKYTVNAGITLGCLFNAWDHFGDKIKEIPLNLPETAGGYPEFLEELKWETDWLLKMEYPDGSGRVSHKLTRLAFSDFIMPQDDDAPRYFTVWSSAATADFAAMMAMAARHFRDYDAAYAGKCLEAALRSWNFLKANPEDKIFEQGDFKTGDYRTSDPDDRLWAAAQIWETTGDSAALKDLEERIEAFAAPLKVSDDWDWGDVENLGLFTYALSDREGRNPAILEKVRKAILESAARIAGRVDSDKYGCPLEKFYWGCNGTAARLSLNLHAAELLDSGTSYREQIGKIAAYLLGNNFYGRSFVTGLGPNPPMHPHDRRSGADGIDAPWPGYLVGGGHSATDWVDEQEDYSRNEIAINWQAGLVYLLAANL